MASWNFKGGLGVGAGIAIGILGALLIVALIMGLLMLTGRGCPMCGAEPDAAVEATEATCASHLTPAARQATACLDDGVSSETGMRRTRRPLTRCSRFHEGIRTTSGGTPVSGRGHSRHARGAGV